MKRCLITVVTWTVFVFRLLAAGTPFAIHLGEPQPILTNGQFGLKYFPDERLCFVRTEPDYRVIVAAGIKSVLLTGHSMENLVSAKDVLLPGRAGEFDNGYAGISGVWRAPSDKLLAIYHAEDQENMKRIPGGIPGFYCRVALAASTNDGLTFEKLGPIISGALDKNTNGPADQGAGEPWIMAEPGGQYLYTYYTSHDKAHGRRVDICLARCPIAKAWDTHAWQKYYNGQFTEPGLGGRDTPVIANETDTGMLAPHVIYVPQWHKFVMFFIVNAWRESVQPQRSGIYAALSDDGLHWPTKARLQVWKVHVLPAVGRELAWCPTLIPVGEPKDNELQGWLYYGYSENWGHRPPQKPHYLMRRSCKIMLRDLQFGR